MARLRGTMWIGGAALAVALAACAPQDIAAKVTDRAAESVVRAAIKGPLSEVQMDTATRCIVTNATPEERAALARDVGAYAGTLTVANIRAILARPATQACFTAAALPPVTA